MTSGLFRFILVSPPFKLSRKEKPGTRAVRPEFLASHEKCLPIKGGCPSMNLFDAIILPLRGYRCNYCDLLRFGFCIRRCAGQILWNASTPPRQPHRLWGFKEHQGGPFLFGSPISWEYPVWKGYLVSHCKDAEIIKSEQPGCRVKCNWAVSFTSYLPA